MEIKDNWSYKGSGIKRKERFKDEYDPQLEEYRIDKKGK